MHLNIPCNNTNSRYRGGNMEQIIRNAMLSNHIASVIISLALMLFLGFAMTRITKRLRLPNVTAYILTGIIIGPYFLDLIPGPVIDNMDFLSDIALAFIAFSTGEFFRFSSLRKSGIRIVVLTVAEALAASLAVFIVTYFVLGVNITFSIVLAALASATAPASTVMTIRQTGAKGDFVDTLLQVVALDDAVGLVGYSIAISLAIALSTGAGPDISGIIRPIAVNTGVFLLGSLFGIVLRLLMTARRSDDNRLIISVSLLFAFCGICAVLDVSPLLGCMAMGTVYMNISDDEKLFRQLGYFTPPILQLFFIRSGLAFRLDMLAGRSASLGGVSLLVIGACYFISRIAGKYIGAFLGCAVIHKSRSVRNYLGLALIPQAGVAIGLAALGARAIGGEMGEMLETVILASSVLYELIGPACAKLSLYLSRSYGVNQPEAEMNEHIAENSGQDAVELLIQRIRRIQEDLAESRLSEEEKAFQEASDAHAAAVMGTSEGR